jgi:hypothetical protein
MFKLLLSASLYIVLSMVCSRYCGNRRLALVWSYIALFLYAMIGWAIWSTVGQIVTQTEVVTTYINGVQQEVNPDPTSPGFMQGIHLIFCGVVGLGSILLLWVSMSEQRGYKNSGDDSNRAWQPIVQRRSSHTSA